MVRSTRHDGAPGRSAPYWIVAILWTVAATLGLYPQTLSAQETETDAERGPPAGASLADESTADARTDRRADAADDGYFGESHRKRLYREGRLSYGRAALWTALLPGLGNFYARQYFIGGLNMSAVGFSAVIIPYGVLTEQPGFVWVGAGLVGAGYASGFATSYIGVKKFNRRLRRELRIADESESAAADTWNDTPWRAPRVQTYGFEIRFR